MELVLKTSSVRALVGSNPTPSAIKEFNMDWIAAIFELSGSWLIGNRWRLGFILNALGCCTWIYVALKTQVYGLLLVVIPAIIINTRNYIKWTEKQNQEQGQ